MLRGVWDRLYRVVVLVVLAASLVVALAAWSAASDARACVESLRLAPVPSGRLWSVGGPVYRSSGCD